MAVYQRRSLWVLGAVTAILLALMVRLWDLQIHNGPAWVRMAVAQRMISLPLVSRGTILDREGKALHDPQPVLGLAAFPLLVPPLTSAQIRTVAAAAHRPVAEVQAALADRGRDPVWLGWGLSAAAAGDVRILGVPGLALAEITDRYGARALARHVVGYVNKVGAGMGLEGVWDPFLKGQQGPHLAAYLDAAGRPLSGLGVRTVEIGVGQIPADLHVTLSARVQEALETALDGWRPPSGDPPLRGAAVVLSARSGEVLGMASRPNYDQARGPAGLPAGAAAPLLNRAVAAYAPGSVFKPIVLAAALSEGVVSSTADRFTCSGHYDLGDQRFTEPKSGGHGEITLAAAVGQSCNIAFIQVGYEKLGRDRLLKWAGRFGFGRLAGTGLAEEAPGQLPAAPYGGDVAQLAFGQGGLTVTPLQLARAYAALATDGALPPAGLAVKLTAPSGEVLLRPARDPREPVVTEAVARQVALAMERVTDPQGEGTGREAWVATGGSTGKTGSAQSVLDGRPVSHVWFAGWAPQHDPEYVAVVFLEEGRSGGTDAAPLFREIMERLLAGR